jgi:hypothetical protein
MHALLGGHKTGLWAIQPVNGRDIPSLYAGVALIDPFLRDGLGLPD